MKYFLSRFLHLTSILLFVGCAKQNADHPRADDLAVTWELISNQIGDQPAHRAAFTIRNLGKSTLGSEGWALYYNQATYTPRPGAVQGPAVVEQINGDFFRLRPTPNFSLPPGDSITITFDSEYWIIKMSDAPDGLYIVFSDAAGRELEATPIRQFTRRPLTRPDQVNRFTEDEMPIPTPAYRFAENQKLSRLPAEDLLPILPQPKSIIAQSGSFTINARTAIYYELSLQSEAAFLSRSLATALIGQPQAISGEPTGDAPFVHLDLKPEAFPEKTAEAYTLKITPQAIAITGVDAAGVFYGIQSLLALLPVEAWREASESQIIPAYQIVDSPRFPYRGMHLDVARHFHGKAAVLKMLDAMAFYKLNKLHFHLSNEEGWRLAIAALPELTEVGARRGHTLDNAEFLQPGFGSGPDPDHNYGSGYYSRADFIEILRYARERHIEVIPEFNFPGHTRAAIKAMEARYRRLLAAGDEAGAEAYLLSDLEDQSVYRSPQHFTDNTICVCRESVYRFFETMLDEVIEIYQEAGVPLRTFHTGGDEVPPGAWERSPICRDFLEKHPEIDGVAALQPYFLRRVHQILKERGIRTAGWEEVALKKTGPETYAPNPEFAGEGIYTYVWNSLWGNQDLGYRLANAGYPVILGNVTNFYFDLAYDKDPEEPGLYWGGFCDTRQAYEFIPFDLFKSMKRDDMGHLFEEADFAGMERLRQDARRHILGLQGHLWSETLKSPKMLEYYYLPKMIGLAERAWAPAASWETIADKTSRMAALEEDWNRFAHTVGQREFPRLDYLFGGFNYRLAPPGARFIDGRLHANTDFPGPVIRYTLDGSEPDTAAAEYTAPFEGVDNVKLRLFDSRGRGSRTIAIQNK